MIAVRTALMIALAFTLAGAVQTHQAPVAPVDSAPVLVGCADGPTCAVTVSTGPVRTVNVHWVHPTPAPIASEPDVPDSGAGL